MSMGTSTSEPLGTEAAPLQRLLHGGHGLLQSRSAVARQLAAERRVGRGGDRLAVVGERGARGPRLGADA